MSKPIRFGRTMTIERSGDIVSVTEQVIAHHSIVKRVTQVTETVPVEDEKEALAQFLKLLDRQKSGEIDQVGIQCLRNPETRKLRVELSWFEPSVLQ